MSSKYPNEAIAEPTLPMEFPPDPMVTAKAAAQTYLHHVNTATQHPAQLGGGPSANPGMLALAALEFETDIWLLAQGRTPEILFVTTPYQGGPLEPSSDPVVSTSNELIEIARYILTAAASSPAPGAEGFAHGVALYVALRNQLREMVSTMSPRRSDLPWTAKTERLKR